MSAIKETRSRNKKDLAQANHEALLAQTSAASVTAVSTELYTKQRDIRESMSRLTAATPRSCRLGQATAFAHSRAMEESEDE
jgi:hypothetical protein